MLEYLILIPIFIMIAIGSIAVAIILTIFHYSVKLFIKDNNSEEEDD